MTVLAQSHVRPSRGRKKGFVPGSWSDHYYHGIINTFVETECPALTLGDLARRLQAHGGWIKRPLARLMENGVITATPRTTLEYPGIVRTTIYYSLSPSQATNEQESVPAGDTPPSEPLIMDSDCRACEQVGAGRGSCASCSRS